MPMLFVQTNVPTDKLPSDVNLGLTNLISAELSKPAQYIFVSVQHVPLLSFQGKISLLLCCRSINRKTKITSRS